MRALALALALLAAATPALAQPPETSLERARVAFEEGDFAAAARLAADALAGRLSDVDRAEAWRVRGLALFYAGRRGEAAPAIFEYLKLEVDARLDPAFHTPEAIAFFEQVRTERAAELVAYRPEPDRRRLIVALLPPFAQFQNKEPTKGWILAGVGGTLLVANATALALRLRWCNVFGDRTCTDDRADEARAVVMATGWALAGLLVYGVADGLRGYNRWRRRQSAELDTMSFGLAPEQGGVRAQLRWRF